MNCQIKFTTVIKLSLETPNDYKDVIKYCKQNNIPKPIYEIHVNNRSIQVVIGGLPVNISKENINDDLDQQCFTVNNIDI